MSAEPLSLRTAAPGRRRPDPLAVVEPVAVRTAGSGGPVVDRVTRRRVPREPGSPVLAVLSTASLLLGLLLVGLVVQLVGVGALRHGRDQATAYDLLREQLANATAPVGQTAVDGVVLAPGAPVALLRIPSLGLEEVVLEGTTSGVLTSGPGHRRDTVLPGQAGTAVVFGRRAAYGAPFRALAGLRRGATIVTVTGQGRATYTVTGVRRAGDRLPPPLAAGAGRLTLVTARGLPLLPAGVVRVDAQLVGTAQPSAPRALRAGGLSSSEQPLRGDGSAWVLVVLWGQALLVAALGVTWLKARWGGRQAYVVAVPVVGVLLVAVGDSVSRLLPNLL